MLLLYLKRRGARSSGKSAEQVEKPIALKNIRGALLRLTNVINEKEAPPKMLETQEKHRT